jgi:hypothetical protein
MSVQTQSIQGFVDSLVTLAWGQAGRSQGTSQILLDVQVFVIATVLYDQSDIPAVWWDAGKRPSIPPQLASISIVQPRQNAKQTGLATTVGAYQCPTLVLLDIQRYRFQDASGAMGFRNLLDLNGHVRSMVSE